MMREAVARPQSEVQRRVAALAQTLERGLIGRTPLVERLLHRASSAAGMC